MKIKNVIFDLDGTLIDSQKDIAISVNQTLRHFGLPEIDEEEVVSYIGGGLEPLLKKSIGEDNLKLYKFAEVLSFYKKVYAENCVTYTKLYPGVIETLEFLKSKNINIFLATNKLASLSEKILKGLEINHYFADIMGPEKVTNRKPHPEMINTLLDTVQGEATESMIVGDTYYDILCGKNAGTYTCTVTYGMGLINELIDICPDVIICDLRKLILLLDGDE